MQGSRPSVRAIVPGSGFGCIACVRQNGVLRLSNGPQNGLLVFLSFANSGRTDRHGVDRTVWPPPCHMARYIGLQTYMQVCQGSELGEVKQPPQWCSGPQTGVRKRAQKVPILNRKWNINKDCLLSHISIQIFALKLDFRSHKFAIQLALCK